MKALFVIAFIILLLAGLGYARRSGRKIEPAVHHPAYISTAGDYTLTLQHGDLGRTYKIHVPPKLDFSNPSPVVMVFHGGGGTAEGIMQDTNMNATSDRYGFIAVYPQGTGPSRRGRVFATWNAGRCCGSAVENNIDDVGFISKLIDDLQAKVNVNSSRIYLTGHSNGAQMSYRVACELSGRIAAIAPVGSQAVFEQCKPEKPVPVMHFHGTADPCALYNGGESGGCFQNFTNEVFGTNRPPVTWQVEPVPVYLEKWRTMNGAVGEPTTSYQNGAATCQAWGYKTPREVILCTIQGMGHTWPGGSESRLCDGSKPRLCELWKKTVGPRSNDINASEEMWKFFQRHTR